MSLPPPLPPENPYAAPTAVVDDPTAGDLVLADRSVRLAAAIVDSLLLFVPLMLVVFMDTPMMGGFADNDLAVGVLALLGFGGTLAVLVINSVMLHRSGQTIGKRMLSIRILLADGTPCSLLRVIFARWLPVTLMGLVPIVGYVIGFVDALLIFRDDRRCLHDQIAGTIVVRA